jgi:hypothetical protein
MEINNHGGFDFSQKFSLESMQESKDEKKVLGVLEIDNRNHNENSLIAIGQAGLNESEYGIFDINNDGRITKKEIEELTKYDDAPKPLNIDKNKLVMPEEMQKFDEYSQKTKESIEEFEKLKGEMGMQQPKDLEEKLFSSQAVQRLRDYGLDDNAIVGFLDKNRNFTGVNLSA